MYNTKGLYYEMYTYIEQFMVCFYSLNHSCQKISNLILFRDSTFFSYPVDESYLA